MRRAILLWFCMIAFVLGGCDTRTEDAKEAVRRQLIDPDSAKFQDVRVVETSGAVCGFVNAKNRVGGYDGMAPFFYQAGRGAVLVREVPTEDDFKLAVGLPSVGERIANLMEACEAVSVWEEACSRKISVQSNKYCDLVKNGRGGASIVMEIYEDRR